MSFETDTDRLELLKALGGNKTGQYTPFGYPTGSVKTRTIYGIFDQIFIESEQVSGYKPTFNVRTSDVSDIAFDAQIVIDSVTHYIKQWEPDGTGLTLLILEKQ